MGADDDIKKEYLFSWNEIPGNDDGELIEFLMWKYNIDWVETAKIEKSDDVRTVKVYVEKNYLSLNLNNERTKVYLKIDDGRTDELITKTENGKLNIYEGKMMRTDNEIRNDFKEPGFGLLSEKMTLSDIIHNQKLILEVLLDIRRRE